MRYLNEAGEGGDPGEGGSNTAASEVSEVEQKARKMGWTPKEEFKGDPEKWRSAEEFVERGENMIPILRDTVKRQQKQLEELHKTMREFGEYHSKTEQRAYERAYQDLKARQIEAVAAGDSAAFVQIDNEIAELNKQASEKRAPEAGPPPEYVEWESRNEWVKKDKKMLAYAEAQFEYLQRTETDMTYSEVLDEVTKAVKKQFPDKFTNPKRESAPSVEGATPAAKRGGKTYADLPKDAKDACDKFVSKYGIKREEYVKNYFEEQA
jgi:small-conductance mechanosensitive channel